MSGEVRIKDVRAVCYLGGMFDMKNSHLELQVLEGAMGADVGESFGELLGRGVGGKGFYWVGSGRADSFRYRIQIIRISSQNSDGKISMRWMCENSTYACAAGRSLCRKAVNASMGMARLLWELTAPMSIARP